MKIDDCSIQIRNGNRFYTFTCESCKRCICFPEHEEKKVCEFCKKIYEKAEISKVVRR